MAKAGNAKGMGMAMKKMGSTGAPKGGAPMAPPRSPMRPGGSGPMPGGQPMPPPGGMGGAGGGAGAFKKGGPVKKGRKK